MSNPPPLIKLTQGPNTDVAGHAVFGTLIDGAVVFQNDDDTGVTAHSWSLIDAAGGGLAIGFLTASPSGSFPQPDVHGGYLLQLTVTYSDLTTATTTNTLQVKEASGRYIPPAGATDVSLQFAGQTRGWSQSMEQWLRYLDALTFTSMTINSFAPAVPVVEAGATIANPAFAASYSSAPTTALLTNSFDGEVKDVHATPTSFASGHSFLRTTPNQQVVFTLTCTQPPSVAPPPVTCVITWGQRSFAGVVASGASLAALVAAATYTTLNIARAFSFTLTDDGTHKMQFAYPTRYGPPVVKDHSTGFNIGFSLLGAFSRTNASGVTENYNQYEFAAAVNGTLVVDVT